MNKNLFSLVFLIGYVLFSNEVKSHEVSHFSKEIWNQWRLANGVTIYGNFLYSNKDTLVLKLSNCGICSVSIQQLVPQDQLLAKTKIKNYQRQLQNTLLPQPETTTPSAARSSPGMMMIVLTIIFVMSGIILRKTARYIRYSVPLCLTVSVVLLSSFLNHQKKISATDLTLLIKAFAPYKEWVQTRYDQQYFYVSSNGIPQHPMMAGIRSWQNQVPLPQTYTGNNSWSIPIQPQWSDTPLSTRNNFFRGAIALAVNGIPVFNALNNRGEDALLAGELDQWGGHCGRADDYHYHVVPEQLSSRAELPLGFALDGFAIYGKREPDGSALQVLDNCNGHLYGDNSYHYHASSQYPYSIGAFRGRVQIDPRTPAPENQIIPQAFTKPIRPPGKPLRGATIQQCEATGINEYTLTYQFGSQTGKVQYRWNQQSVSFYFYPPNGTPDSAMYPIKK